MKPAPVQYVRATSIDDALARWNDAGPDARVLAGGQTLIPLMAFRMSEPAALVDIGRIAELRGIRRTGDAIRIGAATTHAELGADPLIRAHLPVFADAVPLIAHAAIRNRGTIGGSLAYADAAAELAACTVAMEATLVLRSRKGERRVAARDFFKGMFETALAPFELIAAVEVPIPPDGERAGIDELARRSGDYAMAGLVARVAREGQRITNARLVYFGVGTMPVVAERTAAALVGTTGHESDMVAIQAHLDNDLDPPSDQHGGPDFKRQLARVLLARTVRRLA
jgi:carbon-monoxide dehydrogenase medium subunit